MVMDDGDDKKRLDLLTRLVLANGYEIRTRRGNEEEERNMPMSNTTTSAATTTLLGKRKINQDSSSSSSSYFERRLAVSEEPIRVEPIMETKLNHHDASSLSLSFVESQRRSGMYDEPIRAEPIREIKPVRGRNRRLRREPGETPGWVVDLMRKKKGADAKLIIEKKISASDLRADQGRLLMPFKQIVETHFLNEAEVNILNEYRRRARKKGVDVILVDADGREWGLNLRIWNMNTSTNFVLCSGWKKVIRLHKPEKGQIIRLWSFHSQDGKLYFAIPLKHQAQDMAQPQALYPDQAMALPLAPAIATASASSMALVVSRDSDELFLREETNMRLFNYPKRKKTRRVCIPVPTRDFDLNRPLPQVCTEMAPLKAVQETATRTLLVPVTATSPVSDTELDLELRL